MYDLSNLNNLEKSAAIASHTYQTTKAIMLNTIFGFGIGLGIGELVDVCPYFNQIIPEGIAHIANAFTENNTVDETVQQLKGNLHSVGAVTGIIGNYIKPMWKIYHDKKEYTKQKAITQATHQER